jgi:hypothetical protein
MFWAGQRRKVQGFITMVKMIHILELSNCLFLKFSILYFQTKISHKELTMKSKIVDKGE